MRPRPFRILRLNNRSDSASACFSVNASAAGEPRLGPTLSAMTAPRSPIASGSPVVVSIAVWCSISAFSSAPISTICTVSQVHSRKPIIAASGP